jgi:hypothetical protein
VRLLTSRSGVRASLGALFTFSKKFASKTQNEAREIRTPNLLIWSQTRCRCAIAPCLPNMERKQLVSCFSQSKPKQVRTTKETMDTLGFEPRASRMLSGCDTTTPCARDGYSAQKQSTKNIKVGPHHRSIFAQGTIRAVACTQAFLLQRFESH